MGIRAGAIQTVTGTFEGTGNSTAVECVSALVDLTFAGTATVNFQWSVDGTNYRTYTAYTATAQFTFESPGGIPVLIRLNCSAHTNDVTYAIKAKTGE